MALPYQAGFEDAILDLILAIADDTTLPFVVLYGDDEIGIGDLETVEGASALAGRAEDSPVVMAGFASLDVTGSDATFETNSETVGVEILVAVSDGNNYKRQRNTAMAIANKIRHAVQGKHISLPGTAGGAIEFFSMFPQTQMRGMTILALTFILRNLQVDASTAGFDIE